MSNFAAEETSGLFTYDFSFEGQAFELGQKDLGDGVFGMYSGDVNADGIVNLTDRAIWAIRAGKQGYFAEDTNLDTQVKNDDKNEFLLINKDIESKIPE